MNKDLRNTLVWMVFATAIVGIAFWQAQITLAKEIAAKNKVLPPPPKTRHAVRPAAATFTGDPVADYLDRCKKGLTDQEIGWIIEDFQNAGLAFYHFNETAPDPFIIAYRAAQIRWYHDLLVDGFRLSPEQSAQASVKLRQLHEKDTAEFQQARYAAHRDANSS